MRERKRALARALAIALAASVVLCHRGAAAQGPASSTCIERLDDAEVTARIDMIQALLDQDSRLGKLWWFGWMSVLLGVGALQTTVALGQDQDRTDRAAFATAATGSYLGFLATLFRPAPTAYAARKLRRMADGTSEERRRKLERAEKLLARSADRQASGYGWDRQLQLVLWLGATSVLLGVIYDAWRQWTRLALGSLVVFEARVFTQPTQAISGFGAYQLGSNPCMAPELRAPQGPPGPSVGVAAVPGGLGLQVRF